MNKMSGIPDTLYIPLMARIYSSRKFPDCFYDEKALSLETAGRGDSIAEKSAEYHYMSSVARYYNVDRIVKEFIGRHGRCNIVNLGAGLDTSYWRMGANDAVFYEVDLPEVIEMRREYLGENEREVLIGCDMFDYSWMDKVNAGMPTMFVSSGVFMYFEEERIIALISEIKSRFKDSELVFDAINRKGMAYANKYVRKTGNKDAEMHFYVENSTEFGRKAGCRLVSENPPFKAIRKALGNRLKFSTRVTMAIVDMTMRMKILHFAF